MKSRQRFPKIGTTTDQRHAHLCRAKFSRCRVFTFNAGNICLECLDDGATPETVRLGKPRVRRGDPILTLKEALA